MELKPGPYLKETQRTWKFLKCGNLDDKGEEMAKKYAEQIHRIDDFATAYIGLPYEYYENYDYRGFTNIEMIQAKGKQEGQSKEEIDQTIEFYKSYVDGWNPDDPVL